MEEKQTTNEAPSAPPAAPELASEPAKKKANWLKRVVYGVIIIILLLLAIQVVIADKYQMQVQVIAGEKKVGVNPTTEMLDFGDLSADTSATRLVTMSAGGKDTFVHITKFGSAADLVKVSTNNFTMKSGDEKKIEFAMYMPPSAPVGKWYKGWIMIFKIPKVW
jgi:cold shock CspA family protein